MPNILFCEKCDFKCSKPSIYNKHLDTAKHKRMGNNLYPYSDISGNTTSLDVNQPHICKYCCKSYKYLSGLSRHKRMCHKNNCHDDDTLMDDTVIDDSSIDDTVIHDTDITTEFSEDKISQTDNVIIRKRPRNNEEKTNKKLKQLIAENSEMKMMMFQMMATNSQFQLQMLKLMNNSQAQLTNHNQGQPHSSSISGGVALNGDNPTFTNSTTNNNNNTFNMNMFLNEKCKDAMNMKDFIDSIQLNMTDMENMNRLGYVEGMSNIFINNLQKTDLYKRPVHCSDVKRETLYVKENNQWERDGPDHAKMTNAVLAVEHKNVVLVNEWAKANPRCLNSTTRENEKYIKMAKIVTDGEKEGNIDKVIRKVAKSVAIEKGGTTIENS
jgi:hypothetical protein